MVLDKVSTLCQTRQPDECINSLVISFGASLSLAGLLYGMTKGRILESASHNGIVGHTQL